MNKLNLLTVVLLMMFSISGRAQLTIESCQQKARDNYPLIKQFGLIEQTRNFNLENAAKGYLPQISISGKVTYQSDVTKIPISIPGQQIDGLTRDQYQAVAEISQVIWDGGVIRTQNKLTDAAAEVEKQALEVDLYALKERVNQLFFGILLIHEQLKQNELLQKELQTTFERVSAFMKNGAANEADLDIIRVEQLKVKQLRIGLTASGKSYGEVLSALIKEPVSEETILVKTGNILPGSEPVNLRPELLLFDARRNLLENQRNALFAANKPRLGAFMQGGYGKPGLNMLKNEFSPFYIGGIRFSWNFGGYYTLKNNLAKIGINQQSVDAQRETFLFNNNLVSTQQKNEVSRANEIIARDVEIIRLRTNIKHSAEAKVANGTLSVSDLIREINAENLAMQEKSIHEIQLMLLISNLKNTLNN
jgi:outer membrane protein TolC